MTTIIAGVDQSSSLEKVQFGRLINGKLVYGSGESDSTVFEGLIYEWIQATVYTQCPKIFDVYYLAIASYQILLKYHTIRLAYVVFYCIESSVNNWICQWAN